MTPLAQKELIELNKDLEEVNRKIQLARQHRLSPSPYYAKEARIDEKIDAIKKFGLATKEVARLKRELHGFRSIKYDSSLGMRSSEKIGYSKVLNSYVLVSATSYTSFMRNVKGCGSLAGKTDISGFRLISKKTYDDILAGQGKTKYKSKGASPEVLGYY
jgi:hypothetical protein